MYALLWVFWLCQGGSAEKETVVGDEAGPAPPLNCEDLLLSFVILAALAFGTKWLCRAFSSEDRKKTKRAEPLVHACPDELESRLLQAFSQMEKELVKLVTFVRSHKASLALRHRGCKTSECQQARESARAFNLVTESGFCPARGPSRGCSIKSALKTLAQEEKDLVGLLYKLHRLKMALATGWRDNQGGSLPHDLVMYTIQDET